MNRVEGRLSVLFDFAVPLFFLISGYLFAFSYKRYNYKDLLLRKFRSLYIPVICWGVISLALSWPISIYAHTTPPNIINYLSLPLLMNFRVGSNHHFWYVRNLLVLFILAPLVYRIAGNATVLVFVIGLTTVLSLLFPALQIRFHLLVTVNYFCIGCLMGCRKNECKVPRSGLVCGASSLLLVLILLRPEFRETIVGSVLIPAVEVCWVWSLYDFIDGWYHLGKVKCASVLFFVYCMHNVALCWCGGLWRVAFGVEQTSRFLGWVFLCGSFWLFVIFALAIRRRFGRVFDVLSGGRG